MNSNLTPLLLIGLAVALFYVYISPEYTKIDALRAQAAEYSNALDRADQIGQLRDELLTKYNSFSPDNLNKLETMLPDKIDDVKLVLDMSNVAAKYNLAMKSIKVEQVSDSGAANENAEPSSPYGTLKVTFSVDAPYDTFISFLKDVEQSLRIIDVAGISIKPTAAGDRYQYTVVINTYWLK